MILVRALDLCSAFCSGSPPTVRVSMSKNTDGNFDGSISEYSLAGGVESAGGNPSDQVGQPTMS